MPTLWLHFLVRWYVRAWLARPSPAFMLKYPISRLVVVPLRYDGIWRIHLLRYHYLLLFSQCNQHGPVAAYLPHAASDPTLSTTSTHSVRTWFLFIVRR